MVLCRKCGEEVHESYLSRRRHVFIAHQNDIKDQLKDFKRLKKTDILFQGFINIHNCFPEYAVCSDFQCNECGRYYCSQSGMKYHAGVSHQNIIMIDCPFENCDFKTGSGCHASDHVKLHMKKNKDNKDKVSIHDLAFYISPQSYAKFKVSCECANQIAEKMPKHYFPICMSQYDNFQDDFKKDLFKFKKNYLKPYVLRDLNTDNQRINESEIISSYNGNFLDTRKKSSGNSDIPGRSVLNINDVFNKKRKHKDSNDNDVIFLKEKKLKSVKNISSDEPTCSRLSAIKDNSSTNRLNDIINDELPVESPGVSKTVNKENTVEEVEINKITKEILPFDTVSRNFFKNISNGNLKEEKDTTKVKTVLTPLTLKNKVDGSHKNSVYENLNKKCEEVRSLPRKRIFYRNNCYRKSIFSYSNYARKLSNNVSRRYSTTSRNYNSRRLSTNSRYYDNSSGYSNSSSNQKYFSYR